jgi:CHAT domain-containing protein/tetratricopeptide (TPR) repeat protein
LLKRWPLLLLGGAVVLGAVVIGARGLSRKTVLGELAAARPARVLSPRFSIPVEYRRCAAHRRAGETVPRDSCGAASEPPAALETLDTLAATWESTDPDSLQASALVAMLGFDETEKPLDVAIARLSRALPLSSRRVPLLVDLSGAHLARAQRTQDPRDLLQGLDYALEALDSEPRDSAALFNTALALELLGLDEQGTLAWTAYLRVDSTSRWAAEARRRQQGLRHPPPPRKPGPGSSEAEVRAFATNHPQEARLLGWEDVLGRWGVAWEAGKTAEAAGLLHLADRLGATLARHGRDASLADAVKAIHAAEHDPAATRGLARAHRGYAAGQVLLANHDDAARDSFASVVRARPRSPALVRWAEVSHAGALVYAGKFAQAEARLVELLPRIDSVRHPALAARARWIRGKALINDLRPAEARASYQCAARLFERAGETENAGANHQMAGEAAYNQRDTLAAYRDMHHGLMALRGFRSSMRLHNTLFVLAYSAATDAMPLAAARVQDEDVSVARRLDASTSTVEALLGRARVRVVAGLRREAAQDLDGAGAMVATMRGSEARNKLEATVRSLRALVATDSASLAGLDSAVAYFAGQNDLVSLLPALLRRADVRRAHGRLAAATADLNDAITRVHLLSQTQEHASLRAAVMERARDRVDQLVMLHVRERRAEAALQALEQGRVSFAPWASGGTARPPGPPVAPPGQVAVEYALIGDTLLTWTVRGGDVRLKQDTVDRGELLRTIERVDDALASPARAGSARPGLRRLYDLLVRPVEDRLGPPETPLVILADGEVAAVPFDALLNGSRYLLEDHALRFAATLADAARPAPRSDGARPALLVADPAFDAERNLTLDRLRGARAEVDSLRVVYPESVVLGGASATRAAFAARAPGAGVIHYAGHAVFDDARPERSALVLAGADTTGHLAAEAVNALPLHGVRLVVLSACSTVRSREGRSGGFAGMSGALLAAGAGGVVGSLWQANDRLTQPLMLEFHRAYRRSGDAAAALREAQLRMLRSTDRPERRSPAAWAGFRSMGS